MRKELLGAISALALMTGAAYAQDAGSTQQAQPQAGQAQTGQAQTQTPPPADQAQTGQAQTGQAQTGQVQTGQAQSGQTQPPAGQTQTDQAQTGQTQPAEEGEAQVEIIPPEGEAEVEVETEAPDAEAQAETEVQTETEGQADVQVIPPEGEADGEADVQVIEPAEDAEAEVQTEASQTMAAGATNVDELMGMSVVGSDGEELGEIEDVILDAESGEAQQVVIASGGFLGLGERRIAVEYSELQIEPGADAVQAMGLTQQSVESMPEFEYGENVVSVTRPAAEAGAEAEAEVDAVVE
ncbi:PRC-barrel domain-containing protein [Arenibaculum sp.]|jgi:sporulation protein YlmC with PRC-barrel domain|uniref:PRC-barrel domain-containing protein n=1 Tax=Arenibaculum sp. TaxID=2865862 RepID=UPI002E0F9A71|nr:PRC-barrel domain-containing protein [Arenibaculum sp.]